jgi:hypothetical protein
VDKAVKAEEEEVEKERVFWCVGVEKLLLLLL